MALSILFGIIHLLNPNLPDHLKDVLCHTRINHIELYIISQSNALALEANRNITTI